MKKKRKEQKPVKQALTGKERLVKDWIRNMRFRQSVKALKQRKETLGHARDK